MLLSIILAGCQNLNRSNSNDVIAYQAVSDKDLIRVPKNSKICFPMPRTDCVVAFKDGFYMSNDYVKEKVLKPMAQI